MIRNRAETDTEHPAGSWRPPKYLRDIIGKVYQEENISSLQEKYNILLQENEELRHKANEAEKYKGQRDALLKKEIPLSRLEARKNFLYATWDRDGRIDFDLGVRFATEYLRGT